MHLYVLTNTVNGKRYVGQCTRNIEDRFRDHKANKSNMVVGRAIKKHGWENFKVQTCSVNNLDELNELEEFMVSELGSHVSEHGYNVQRGGKNHTGHKLKPEVIARIAAANRGRKLPQEQIERQRQKILGRKHTDEERARISAGNTGKKFSPERRMKISAALKGKKRTPEMIEAMRQRQLGKKCSAETKAKMSASHRDRQARRVA